MPVSKHNLWKRQKNGLMKLVRSHSDWLERRREMKTRKKSVPVKDSQWWEKDAVGGTPTPSVKPVKQDSVKSVKRTQVGKKI